MTNPTCLIAGMFNYDTCILKRQNQSEPLSTIHEVGGTGGVVSKLFAVTGWHAFPIGRFDDTIEGNLLTRGLADAGCDTRFVTNTPDGGTTLLTVTTTQNDDGTSKKSIRTSNARDKARGVSSRFPRWAYIKRDRAATLAQDLDFTPDVLFFDTPAAGHRDLAQALKQRGTLVWFEPCNPKDTNCQKAIALADVVKFSNEDFSDISFVEQYPDKLFIQTLGGPEGARFRFPGAAEWVTVPGVVNTDIVSPEGCGDWTSVGFLTTLHRSGGTSFTSLTPERVAEALALGQRYASRNASYLGAVNPELVDELGVRDIVNTPLHP